MKGSAVLYLFLICSQWSALAQLDSLRLAVQFGHTGPISSLAISAEKPYLVTGSWDETARLWSLESGQELQQFVGHSDVVHGAIVVKDKEIADQLYFFQNAIGAVPGPQDCFLVLRGIKTLHLRVERACKNAKKIAKFLNSHPKIGISPSKGIF